MIIGKYKDLGTPIGYTSDNVHEIHYCPYCVEIRGKPDKAGKLYFNVNKGEGLCFKCETPVFKNITFEVTTEISKFLQKIKEKWYKVEVDLDEDRKTYTLQNWTFPISNNVRVANYLSKRNITQDQIERYHLSSCFRPVEGVVVPNHFVNKNVVDFFQIRDISDNAWIKYINPHGEKPIYGIDFLNNCEKVFVAEGVFSSIAATNYSENFGGLGTYGKFIKDSYLKTLKTLTKINEYYLIYDGGEFWSIIKAANKLVKTGRTVKVVLLPYDEDPNSVSIGELQDCVDNLSVRYTLNTKQHMIDTYKKAYKRSANEMVAWEKLRCSL